MRRLTLSIVLVALAITTVALTSTHSANRRTETLPASSSSDQQTDVHFIRQFPIVMKDLVFERNSGKFFASIPSRAGAMGNSIAKIDPATGQVESFVFIGSEPGQLALSDDGHTLYVSLDGAAAVRRFDTATLTAGPQFPLGDDSFNGPLSVKDLSVAPGNPNLVAVSRKVFLTSPDFKGVAVYDQGVKRTLETPGHTGSDFIAFSSSADTLYGNSDGASRIQRMNVTNAGVTVATTVQTNSFGRLKFDNGFLYFQFGGVYNAATLTPVGTFTPNGGFQGPPQFEPDSTVDRIFFLNGTSAFGDTDTRTLTVQAFSQSTFVPTGSFTIPNVRGQLTDLVRWGSNGLAFGTTGGQFFIIQSTLVPSNDPVPSPTPTPSPTSTPTPTPTPTPGPGQLREVSVVAKDIVIDPTGTIYASVPSSAGANANSIVTIDPVTNVVGPGVVVGNDPNRLAISDDGQVIYVGIDGAKSVRRFDVPTRTPGLQFLLDSQNPRVAVDLAISPGQTQTVAVARGDNPNSPSGGVGIYDDGVLRPNTTAAAIGSSGDIEYSGSPFILYGLGDNYFRKMAVVPCGISILATNKELLTGISGATKFRLANNQAFGIGGVTANADAGTVLGTYQITNDVATGLFGRAVLPDPANNRVYFFLQDSSADFTPKTMLIRAYDMQTFKHVGSLALPNISGFPSSVVRWGTDGFAFRTTTNKVYLIQTSLIPNPSQPPVPAPTPTPPSYTLRGLLFNNGTTPLPPVTFQLSGGASGTVTTNADGTFAVPNLPFCSDITVTPISQIPNYTIFPSSLTITPSAQNNPNQSTAVFQATPKTIQFSGLAVSVPEGNTLKITVTRQGNISAPATVNYQTSNGTATDRSDFGTAVGTVRFDANQNSKQITIFTIDDVRDEPDETFSLTLSDPNGALLGFPSVMPITIVDNDASNGTVNPIDDATFFVRQHYRDFLLRDPDAPGLAFWVNEITSCGSNPQCVEIKRINVSAAFFLSIEFQETGYLSYRVFKAAYGDATSPNVSGTVPVIRFNEFLADVQRLGEGVQVGVGNWQQQLEDNKNAYALEFVSRPRFVTAFPNTMTADEFVTKLNQNSGGVLSAAEKTQLVDQLGATPADTAKRAAVLRSVAEDSDLRTAELNRAFVLMQFYGYLQRNPDDPQDVDFSGWKFWLDKLNQFNGNFVEAEMVKAFITSTEYRQRFGP